jgi:hypothetical protein
MKPYFIAALSFVGVLGSAAGAMAINNDTLTHGGSDLVESASRALITTSTVNPDGTVSIQGVEPGAPGVLPSPDPSSTPGATASASPQALTNLPTVNWNGATGGSGTGSLVASSPTTPSHSAARPIATPAAGAGTPVSGVTGGSSWAAPKPAPSQPAAGSGNQTPPTPGAGRRPHPERGTGTKPHDRNQDDSHDSRESDDD